MSDRGKVRRSVTADEAGFEDYGCRRTFHVDKNARRKVLITGAGSYIGESFAAYVKEHYPHIGTETIDMLDGAWRERDFSGCDAVFHVAGIAHADVGKVSAQERRKYYEVNAGLAVETAKKAKREGVGQFLYMSSMIIYGAAGYVDGTTLPKPANFYGDSKWRGDKGVRRLADGDFRVAVLRPPMVYGRGSKGNYPVLAKIARRTPVFPDYGNKRSMLYIDNLCEFVAQLVLSGEGGIYFPQNGEYSRTSEVVKLIGDAAGSPVHLTKWLSPAVWLALHLPGRASALAAKAFGDSCYDEGISRYEGLDYQLVGLKESVRRAEGKQKT